MIFIRANISDYFKIEQETWAERHGAWQVVSEFKNTNWMKQQRTISFLFYIPIRLHNLYLNFHCNATDSEFVIKDQKISKIYFDSNYYNYFANLFPEVSFYRTKIIPYVFLGELSIRRLAALSEKKSYIDSNCLLQCETYLLKPTFRSVTKSRYSILERVTCFVEWEEEYVNPFPSKLHLIPTIRNVRIVLVGKTLGEATQTFWTMFKRIILKTFK